MRKGVDVEHAPDAYHGVVPGLKLPPLPDDMVANSCCPDDDTYDLWEIYYHSRDYVRYNEENRTAFSKWVWNRVKDGHVHEEGCPTCGDALFYIDDDDLYTWEGEDD